MQNDINVSVSGPMQPTSTYKTVVLKGNHSFDSQVTEPNTKYVIKHNFDLDGGSVTIPQGCLLEFDGGSIANGTLVGQDTILSSHKKTSAVLSVTLSGTFVLDVNMITLAAVATSGNYNDLTNKPVIPTNVSAFNNDAHYTKGTAGNTRPSDVDDGYVFFDASLSLAKPVWWSGTKWVEADGCVAGVQRAGTTSQRPVGTDIYVGFKYYDTDIKKEIIASAISESTVTWVDSHGRNAASSVGDVFVTEFELNDFYPDSSPYATASSGPLFSSGYLDDMLAAIKKGNDVYIPISSTSDSGFIKVTLTNISSTKVHFTFKARNYECIAELTYSGTTVSEYIIGPLMQYALGDSGHLGYTGIKSLAIFSSTPSSGKSLKVASDNASIEWAN